uniref:Uncharacterized protein n=1 Tax=Oryza punctata TaxID=4537 RepID=A0A0E0LAQ5_ORYPU
MWKGSEGRIPIATATPWRFYRRYRTVIPSSAPYYHDTDKRLRAALMASSSDAPVAPPHDVAPNDKRAYEERVELWEEANRMNLMVIKDSISPGIRNGIPCADTAKGCMANVEKAFRGSSTIYVDAFTTRLHQSRYDERQNAERQNKQAFPTKALKTNENLTDEPNESSAIIVCKLYHKSRNKQEDYEGFRKWLP